MKGNFDYEPMGILDSTHLKYFTKKSLTELVQNAGYTVKVADFSANDYPDETIKNILQDVGLKPTAAFWNIVNQPESRAFQHKFILELSDAPKLPTKPKGINDQKPEFLRNAEMNDLRNKVKNLEEHAQKQAEIIEHYAAENAKMKRDIIQRTKHALSILHSTTKRKTK